jgi:hypothetical protein
LFYKNNPDVVLSALQTPVNNQASNIDLNTKNMGPFLILNPTPLAHRIQTKTKCAYGYRVVVRGRDNALLVENDLEDAVRVNARERLDVVSSLHVPHAD